MLDLSAHYFWGVKGPYAFFRSADGANGFSELEIFEAKTGKKIFSATFYDSFQFTTAKGGAIAIRFSTELTADCSYPKEGKVCWEKMLKNSGVPAGLYAKAPDCPIEINEADGDKLPAAVAAPARVDDLSHPQLKFEKGPLDCRIKQ